MTTFAARRAVLRWSGRTFRREWRRQLLVVALLTVTVAAAVGSITVAYNASASDNAEFGSASQVLRFDGVRRQPLEAGVASARRSLGTIEIVGHRAVAVPGSVETVDFRAQDPDGRYGHELLAVRTGSYPSGPSQIAVTDKVAELLRLRLGSTVALDGRRRTVVGIVENPRKLADEFALVDPSSAAAPDQVTLLLDADPESVDSFVRSVGDGSALVSSEARQSDRGANTLAMFSVATVFIFLASLVAAAGFTVVAQRRLRQLGMLAAVGATERHLRVALVANGAIAGAIAAVCGTVVGLALWMAAAPALESAVGHRIDRLSLPAALLGTTVVVAIVAATAAAWWPARTVARLPVMLALSGRPPRPRPVRQAAIAAAALVAVGIGSLALSNRDRPPLIVAGIVATIVGFLLLGPPAIRIFSGLAGRLSIAPRLALRDLARYQARSGAALAAVALTLGIAATVMIVSSAEEGKKSDQPPNLSDRQLRLYTGPSDAVDAIPADALKQRKRLAAGATRLAAQLDSAAVLPLSVALERGARAIPVGGRRAFPPMDLMRRYPGPNYRPEAKLYVATPALLSYLGIDPGTIRPGTDFLADASVPTRELVIPSFRTSREFPVTNIQRIDTGRHLFGNPLGDSAAGTKPAFITIAALHRHGWRQVPAGWLLESKQPLTSDQIARARRVAGDAGLSIEARRGDTSFATTMAIATAAGALLALGILAMTVGLIRGESANDVRTLAATGATAWIRRAVTATTAGGLALLGALLGVAGAYIVLVATYYDDLGYLSDVPVLHLAFAVVGVPLVACAAGWLLSGREPQAIARRVIE